MTTIPVKTDFSGHELSAKSAVEIVALLKRKEVSAQELVDICAARLAQVEPHINATPTLCVERAKSAAPEASSKPNILAGLPIGIKDLSNVKDVRTTYGTLGHTDYIPEISDPIVTRLEERGGVVMGKTNTPEFGAGANTFNAVFGPTRNPWNTSRNAAGSSGGAAASLATGEFWLSHGSDHAGSLRTPAAFCGIVGLRPTPGRVPSGGALGFAREGVQGPMARSVEDCALFLDAMAGFDPANPISFPAPDVPFLDTTPLVESNWKIAYSPTLNGYGVVETEIAEILDNAMRISAKNGATVDKACPDITGLEHTYRILRGALWTATIGRAPGRIQKHLKDTLRENLDYGRSLTIDDINDAQLNRSTLFDTMAGFLSTYDVLATAVVGCKPGPVELEYPRSIAGQPMDDYISWLKFAFLATTTGLPAISVPVGFTADGLPVGLQLIGPPRGEAKLLQVAHFIEQSVDFPIGPIDPILG